eukprot:scaffold9045_cov22-Cyclotella_meneghiniana.AAC.2
MIRSPIPRSTANSELPPHDHESNNVHLSTPTMNERSSSSRELKATKTHRERDCAPSSPTKNRLHQHRPNLPNN